MTTDTDDRETISDREAVAAARRYYEIKHARLVNTETGETWTPEEAEKELRRLGDQLRDYIDQRGPVSAEGQPDLMLQPRSLAPTWDVRSFAAQEPLEFQRALEMGGLSLNAKVMKALAETGQLTNVYEQYGEPGSTKALVFGKEKR